MAIIGGIPHFQTYPYGDFRTRHRRTVPGNPWRRHWIYGRAWWMRMQMMKAPGMPRSRSPPMKHWDLAMKHWSFLFSNINVINLAKYWWLIIVDIVTSIPIKDSIINILCLTFNHWDSIHIFCFTIKQAVTKKPQAVGLNHETWIIWGWPIAYNAFSGANEHPFFHPMCRIMADVRPIKTPAQTHPGLLKSHGFSGLWECEKSGDTQKVTSLANDDILPGKLSSFGVQADEGSGPELGSICFLPVIELRYCWLMKSPRLASIRSIPSFAASMPQKSRLIPCLVAWLCTPW